MYQQLTIFSDFMLESSKHAPYVYISAEYFSFEYHFIWNLYDFLFDPIWALMKCSTVLPFSGALAVKNHLSKTIFDLIQHRKIYWIAYDMLGFVKKNERNSKNARREHVSNIITETKGSKVIRMVSKRMTYDIVL